MGNENSQPSVPLNQMNKNELSELRRRSLSAGNLPASLVEHLRKSAAPGALGLPTTDQGLTTIPGSHNHQPSQVSAHDLADTATIQGYIMVQEPSGQTHRLWAVLDGENLYLYQNPEDEQSVDTVHLAGWSVDTSYNGHAICLTHQHHPSILLHADHSGCAGAGAGASSEDTRAWMTALQQAAHTCCSTVDSLCLEAGHTQQFYDHPPGSPDDDEWRQELLQLRKQHLLNEVLRQRNQLKRQQKLHSTRSIEENPPHRGMPSLPTPSSDTDLLRPSEQNIKDIVHLKQRKISTQLKVDSVHRALQSKRAKNGKAVKKKVFKLPGVGSRLMAAAERSGSSDDGETAPCVEEENLQRQLNELHRELEVINKDIMLKQSEQLISKLPERSILHSMKRSKSSSYINLHKSKSTEGASMGSTGSVNKVEVNPMPNLVLSEKQDDKYSGVLKALPSQNVTTDLRHSWSPEAFEKLLGSRGDHNGGRKHKLKLSTPQKFIPEHNVSLASKKQTTVESGHSPKLPSDQNTQGEGRKISEDALANIAAFEDLIQKSLLQVDSSS